MPYQDGTGPLGQGSATGWGRGPCGRGMTRKNGGRFGLGRLKPFRPDNLTKKEEIELLNQEMDSIKTRLGQLKNKK